MHPRALQQEKQEQAGHPQNHVQRPHADSQRRETSWPIDLDDDFFDVTSPLSSRSVAGGAWGGVGRVPLHRRSDTSSVAAQRDRASRVSRYSLSLVNDSFLDEPVNTSNTELHQQKHQHQQHQHKHPQPAHEADLPPAPRHTKGSNLTVPLVQQLSDQANTLTAIESVDLSILDDDDNDDAVSSRASVIHVRRRDSARLRDSDHNLGADQHDDLAEVRPRVKRRAREFSSTYVPAVADQQPSPQESKGEANDQPKVYTSGAGDLAEDKPLVLISGIGRHSLSSRNKSNPEKTVVQQVEQPASNPAQDSGREPQTIVARLRPLRTPKSRAPANGGATSTPGANLKSLLTPVLILKKDSATSTEPPSSAVTSARHPTQRTQRRASVGSSEANIVANQTDTPLGSQANQVEEEIEGVVGVVVSGRPSLTNRKPFQPLNLPSAVEILQPRHPVQQTTQSSSITLPSTVQQNSEAEDPIGWLGELEHIFDADSAATTAVAQQSGHLSHTIVDAAVAHPPSRREGTRGSSGATFYVDPLITPTAIRHPPASSAAMRGLSIHKPNVKKTPVAQAGKTGKKTAAAPFTPPSRSFVDNSHSNLTTPAQTLR